jgi:alpha-galactosidase
MLGNNDARQLGVEVLGDENVRRVRVRPVLSVVIDKISAVMELGLHAADAIYLNGYNSWTDSVERPTAGRMWGLTRASKRVVKKYALDASGDYRFVAEDPRRGHQHGFGYGYVRQGDSVLLFGSLDEDSGFTVIREDLGARIITFDKEPPNRIVRRHEEREIFSLCVEGGTLEEALGRYLARAGIARRPARPIVGYTSWYRHYGNIDVWHLRKDLEGASWVLGGLDLGSADPVFQIDDGYAKVGDWLEFDRLRFPEGPGELARMSKERGLIPGLWIAPFVCERHSRMFVEHRDWLLRDKDGSVVRTGSQWSGGIALDVRNPSVRDYVRNVLRVVTRVWGFKLLKLDFLYAACMVPHDGMNRGELMADALELLRSSVDDDVRLLLCGVPMTSAFGRCEYCRVGPDVGLDWDDKLHMRLLHRERVSTKNSLANARGRRHLDGMVFRCDPDVLFLRDEGVSFTLQQREEMIQTDTTCGGVLFTSDDMAAWNTQQLDAFHYVLEAFKEYNQC